jgi:HEPN domain-containing protein
VSRENDPRAWQEFARRDLVTARKLLEWGDYLHCAPLCEQAVEKSLKAVIVAKTGQLPPRSHNLRKLLKEVDSVPEWVVEKMPDIEAHYFIARYPADIDLEFYDQANTQALLEDAEEICQWLSVQVSELTKSGVS